MKWFKDVRTDSKYDEAWIENFLYRFLDSEEGRQFVQLWRYERKRPKLKAILIGSLRSAGVIDDSCLKGVEECRFILDTLKTLGLKNEIQLDLTLARGLNYYTGAIFDVLNTLDCYPKDAVNGTQLLFINFGDKETAYCLPAVAKARAAGIRTEIFPDSSKMKKQMSYANVKQIPYVVLAGENEMAEGKFTLKNMQGGDQQLVNIEELIDIVK